MSGTPQLHKPQGGTTHPGGGGTCLKKCFFNTYRFSEDLDFTVPIGEPYEVDAILGTPRDLARWAEAEVGIAFPDDGSCERAALVKAASSG